MDLVPDCVCGNILRSFVKLMIYNIPIAKEGVYEMKKKWKVILPVILIAVVCITEHPGNSQAQMHKYA